MKPDFLAQKWIQTEIFYLFLPIPEFLQRFLYLHFNKT